MFFDRKDFSDQLLLDLYRSLLFPRMVEEKMLVLLRQGRCGCGGRLLRRQLFDPLRHYETRHDTTTPGSVRGNTAIGDGPKGIVSCISVHRAASRQRARRAIGPRGCLGRARAMTDFGYTMMQRVVPVLVERLQATRLQMLDVYAPAR